MDELTHKLHRLIVTLIIIVMIIIQYINRRKVRRSNDDEWFGNVSISFFVDVRKGEERKIFALTWYVLSKLSYINLVINDVFPTEKRELKKKRG